MAHFFTQQFTRQYVIKIATFLLLMGQGVLLFAQTNTDSGSKTLTPEPIEVLMFNYSVYDAFYATSIRSILERHRDDLAIREFWSGEPDALAQTLREIDAVIVPYPANHRNNSLQRFAPVLSNYVEAGGTVIFTGTHAYHTLELFDLMDLKEEHYVEQPKFLLKIPSDRLVSAVPDSFSSQNFAYPISVFNPSFVTVAECGGKKSLGYLRRGKGKVIYAGIEFFYDEPATTQILLNALEGAFEQQSEIAFQSRQRIVPQSTTDGTDWKVYPNPFTGVAFAEIVVAEKSAVAMEIYSESGIRLNQMLQNQELPAGTYKMTLPELPNGIFFVRYFNGKEVFVKKIVKMAMP